VAFRLLLSAALLAVVGSLAVPAARANDLDDAGFGIRFSAGLTRFSRYPDSAGIGGAGGGSPWSSSPNPASSGLNPAVGPRRLGFSAQYARVAFDQGQDVDVFSASGSYANDRVGNWQPAAFVLSTNRAARKDGLEFQWDGWGAEVQWAKKCGCNTAFGVNLNVFRSEVDFDLGALAVSDSVSTTWGIRAGVLRKFSDRLHAGCAVELSAAPGETTTHDFMGLGVGDTVSEDTTWSFLVRPGIYTFLTKDLTAYVDYQLGRFWDDTEELTTHRVFAGLDLTVREGVYVRGGTVLDHFGNTSWTAGLGIAPSETLFIDVAYQFNMFPELIPDFGRAHVISVGVSLLL
jgi:opacity protein-like surface antigen